MAQEPTHPHATLAQVVPGGTTTDPYRTVYRWERSGRGRLSRLSFTATDGATLNGYLFRPPASVKGPYPGVVITTGSIQGYLIAYLGIPSFIAPEDFLKSKGDERAVMNYVCMLVSAATASKAAQVKKDAEVARLVEEQKRVEHELTTQHQRAAELQRELDEVSSSTRAALAEVTESESKWREAAEKWQDSAKKWRESYVLETQTAIAVAATA